MLLNVFEDERDQLLSEIPDEYGIKNEKTKRYVNRLLEKKKWNPLLGFPRNNRCFCGSNVKAKKCCIPRMNSAISEELADYISEHWEKLISGEIFLNANSFSN